jgi:mono/diheme cytochrome c family protein
MKGFFLGIVVTLALGLLGAYLFVRGGYLPANADAAPGKLETWAAKTSLDATLAHQAPAGPNPVALTDANLEAGLQVFATNCAGCHGSAAGDTAASPIAKGLYQKPPQFASEGVEDDTEGLTFWKVRHGIRLTSMPSFHETLSDRQIWEVALFLKHMDKLPPKVERDWKLVHNWPVSGLPAHI